MKLLLWFTGIFLNAGKGLVGILDYSISLVGYKYKLMLVLNSSNVKYLLFNFIK